MASIKLIKALTASVAGTTLMTVFMKVISSRKKEPMYVPQILGNVLTGATEKDGELSESVPVYAVGYAAHYGVGKVFAVVYRQLWKNDICRPHPVDGMVVGALSGLVGISAWRTLIALYPKPIRIPLKSYLVALLAAHVVFGTVTFATYRALTEEDTDEPVQVPK
jgi:hypothetical protein